MGDKKVDTEKYTITKILDGWLENVPCTDTITGETVTKQRVFFMVNYRRPGSTVEERGKFGQTAIIKNGAKVYAEWQAALGGKEKTEQWLIQRGEELLKARDKAPAAQAKPATAPAARAPEASAAQTKDQKTAKSAAKEAETKKAPAASAPETKAKAPETNGKSKHAPEPKKKEEVTTKPKAKPSEADQVKKVADAQAHNRKVLAEAKKKADEEEQAAAAKKKKDEVAKKKKEEEAAAAAKKKAEEEEEAAKKKKKADEAAAAKKKKEDEAAAAKKKAEDEEKEKEVTKKKPAASKATKAEPAEEFVSNLVLDYQISMDTINSELTGLYLGSNEVSELQPCEYAGTGIDSQQVAEIKDNIKRAFYEEILEQGMELTFGLTVAKKKYPEWKLKIFLATINDPDAEEGEAEEGESGDAAYWGYLVCTHPESFEHVILKQEEKGEYCAVSTNPLGFVDIYCARNKINTKTVKLETLEEKLEALKHMTFVQSPTSWDAIRNMIKTSRPLTLYDFVKPRRLTKKDRQIKEAEARKEAEKEQLTEMVETIIEQHAEAKKDRQAKAEAVEQAKPMEVEKPKGQSKKQEKKSADEPPKPQPMEIETASVAEVKKSIREDKEKVGLAQYRSDLLKLLNSEIPDASFAPEDVTDLSKLREKLSPIKEHKRKRDQFESQLSQEKEKVQRLETEAKKRSEAIHDMTAEVRGFMEAGAKKDEEIKVKSQEIEKNESIIRGLGENITLMELEKNKLTEEVERLTSSLQTKSMELNTKMAEVANLQDMLAKAKDVKPPTGLMLTPASQGRIRELISTFKEVCGELTNSVVVIADDIENTVFKTS